MNIYGLMLNMGFLCFQNSFSCILGSNLKFYFYLAVDSPLVIYTNANSSPHSMHKRLLLGCKGKNSFFAF